MKSSKMVNFLQGPCRGTHELPLRPHGETSQSATKVDTRECLDLVDINGDVYIVIRTYHIYISMYEYIAGWMDGWIDR